MDHWIYSDEPFNKFQAWVDILMFANFKDKEITINGNRFTIHRGSFLTSIRKLATRWKWSKDKVGRFLRKLRDEKMIKIATVGGTLITVVNYDVYQLRRDSKRDTNKDSKRDTDKDTDRTQLKELSRKNDKERKEKEEELFLDDDDPGEDPAESLRKWKEANGIT